MMQVTKPNKNDKFQMIYRDTDFMHREEEEEQQKKREDYE